MTLSILVSIFLGCGDEQAELGPQVITGDIEGRVLDQTTQEGIAEVEVVLDNGMTASTAANGNFIIRGVVLEHKNYIEGGQPFNLTISARGYLDQEVRIYLNSEGTFITVRLQPGVQVSGFVKSEHGNAVANVRVSLGDRASITDRRGRYNIAPVASGQYRLIAEKAGYEATTLPVVMVGDRDLEQDLVIERSLNGQFLFVRANVHSNTFFGISMVEADGSRVNPLTSFFDEQPGWSPNGHEILFTRTVNNAPRQIYVMDSSGGGGRTLSGQQQNDRNPAWSPDGRRIAFVHSAILEPPAIHVMDADGSNRIKLAECDLNAKPAWSPDGTRIVFSRRVGGKDLGNLDLFVVDTDAFLAGQANSQEPPEQVEPGEPENPPALEEEPLEEGVLQLTHRDEDDVQPAWGPDGSKIAFTIQRSTTSAGVYILDLFTLEIDNVTDITSSYSGYPCWSRDGTKIAFSSNRDGSFGIWVVDVDGSNMERLYDTLGEDELTGQGSWYE